MKFNSTTEAYSFFNDMIKPIIGGTHLIQGQYFTFPSTVGNEDVDKEVLKKLNAFIKEFESTGKNVTDLFRSEPIRCDYDLYLFMEEPIQTTIKGIDQLSESNVYGIIEVDESNYMISYDY